MAQSTSAASDHPPKPSGHATASAQAAPAAKSQLLKFRVAWVEQHETIAFDDTGKPQKPSYRIKLKIVAPYQGSSPVRSYQALTPVKLITGSGTSLYISPNNRDINIGLKPILEDDSKFTPHLIDGSVKFTLSVLSPSLIQSIREIRGRVRLNLPAAPALKVVLSPVSKYLDQQVWIPNLGKKAWVKVIRTDGDSDSKIQPVEVHMSDQAFLKFKDVQFADSQGQHIDSHRTVSDCGCPDTIRPENSPHQSFTVNLPDNGQVVMYFWPKLKSVKVPFTISKIDLPLPKSKPSPPAQAMVTIHSQPVPNGAAQTAPSQPNGPVLHTAHGRLYGGSPGHPPEAPR